MELDALDKKILFHLDHDGRESLKRMAKALRTSAEHIRYRIQRLEKNGIIKRYMAFVNFSELGFVGHGVFCSLRGKDSRAKLVETLEKNDRVYWISDFGGKYDLAFAIAAKDTYEFYKIFNGLKEALSTHASAWEVAIRIRLTQYPRSYLVADEKKRTKEMPFFGVALGHQKIDKIDYKILKLFSQDARADVLSIAKRVDEPASTVSYHLKKLKERGIIQGVAPQISCQKYDYQSYQLFVSIPNLDEKKRNELHAHCLSNPNIVFLIETLGKWNFEIIYDVPNQREFQEHLASLRRSMSWEFDAETGIIFDNYVKYDQFPFKEQSISGL